MTQRFTFGDFELRLASRELLRADQLITVQPKAFDLLAFLLANRDRAVDKQELQDVLWPDVIVTETALTRCVMKARRAVDDDAEQQAVIKTVHGHGYRFVAEVRDATEASADSSRTPAASLAEPAEKPPTWFRRRLAWSVLAALVALGFILWLLRPVPVDPNSLRVVVLPVVNATSNNELDWTELGLMSLLTRMMREDGGLDMVRERELLAQLGDGVSVVPDAELATLGQTLEANYFVTAQLESSGGLLRLSYTLVNPSLEPSRRTVVGEKATELAKLAGQDLISALTGSKSRDLVSRVVSEDAFVNEAYARGLSLQLEGKVAEARALFKVASEQDPSLFWTRYEYAISTRILGELAQAGELLEALRLEAQQLDENPPLIAASNGLGLVRQLQGRYPEAQALYEEGLELARQANAERMLEPLLVNLAILTRRQGDLAAARGYLDEARAEMFDQGRPLTSSVLNTLAQIDVLEGNIEAGQKNYEEAIRAARRENNKRFEASALSNKANLHRRQGQYESAMALLQQSMELRQALGDLSGVARAALGLSAVTKDLGRLTESLVHVRETLNYSRESGDRALEGDALSRIATIQLLRDDADAAERTLDLAWAIWKEVDEPRARLSTQMNMVRVLLLRKDFDAAQRKADELGSQLEPGNDVSAIYLSWLQGEIGEAQGDQDGAADHYAQALQQARTIRSNDLVTKASQRLARVLITQGNIEKAAPLVALAADARPSNWETLRLQGRLALARGNPERGEALLQEAKARAGELWTDADEAQLRAAET